MIEILKFREVFPKHKEVQNHFEKICLEAAANPVEKDKQKAFLDKWLNSYLELFPEFSFAAWDESKKEALGYIICCPDTARFYEKLDQKNLEIWKESFNEFPAHLHINCAPQARGHGVGGKLLNALEEELKKHSLPGLHLITALGARNVGFYKKNGYGLIDQRSFNNIELVLLGKRL